MFDARKAAAHERAGTAYVRHFGHVRDDVVIFHDGTVCAVLEMEGFPFEMAGHKALNGCHAVRSSLLLNIADDDVELIEHLIRHDAVPPFPGGTVRHRTAYGEELARDYEQACLTGLRGTTWLLTIMVHPRVVLPRGRRLFGLPARPEDTARERAPGLALDRRIGRLEDRVRACLTALAPHRPRRLGVRVDPATGVCFSEIAEAHRLVIYARHEPVPLVEPGSLGASIYTERVLCSTACFRTEVPGRPDHLKPHGMMLGFRVYPRRWRVGMFDVALGLPIRFVMTNSYRFHGRTAASDKMATKQRHMENAGDRAASLSVELDEAMDAVERGEHVMGGHHWSFAVHANDFASLEGDAAAAKAALVGAGAVLGAEDIAMEGAFWAQMPGAPSFLRGRAGALPSVAFAAMSSLHGHPTGEPAHHWGRPLYRARTTADTAYDVPWHLRDVGHRLRIGPTGSGKTAHMSFETVLLDPLVTSLGGCQIIFDKDGGNETMVRALGGPVAHLRRGDPRGSGAAPMLGLPDSEAGRAWLHEFLTGLVLDDGRGALSPQDDDRLARGIAFVMRLPVEVRREVGGIAAVRQFMAHEDPLGGGARLEKWCRGGALGWAFDGEFDAIRFGAPISSVDPTDLLADAAVMPPMAAYLLHRASLLRDGRPVVLHADEFRSYLPDFRIVNGRQEMRFAKGFEDFLLTGRKAEWSVDIATQQPEHILDHPIGASVIAQCKTRCLYRNPDARRDKYIDGLGCSERTFLAVSRDMLSGPPSFVLMREDTSILLRLDLSPLPQHIPILSGRDRTVRLLRDLIREHGEDAGLWLPHFRKALEGPPA